MIPNSKLAVRQVCSHFQIQHLERQKPSPIDAFWNLYKTRTLRVSPQAG